MWKLVVFLEPIIRPDHLQRRTRLCWDTIWGFESVILDNLVIINNNNIEKCFKKYHTYLL